MKAAVLHQFGEIPRYEDFPDPIAGEDELLVEIEAVELGNIDKMMANGTHYASRQFLPSLPAIVGLDGLGRLADGRLVGFGGIRPPYGALAERTVINKAAYVPIPEGVDAVTATSVPASALTALFALKWAAKLQAGETVLVNGATGVAGKLAITLAKMLGAGRIVGTGRNEASLQHLTELGADAVIDLKQPDAELAEAFRQGADKGYDIVLDFLWGHPTEVLIQTLTPRELSFPARRVRLIQIGEAAGASINLPAEALRTSGLEISGAGSYLTGEIIAEGTAQVWELIQAGKLQVDVEIVPLKDIASVWQRTDVHGKRLVIVP